MPIEGEQTLIENEKLLDLNGNMLKYVIDNNVDEIIVAIDDRRKNFPVDDILECKLRGVNILDVSTFFERQTGRIKLTALH